MAEGRGAAESDPFQDPQHSFLRLRALLLESLQLLAGFGVDGPHEGTHLDFVVVGRFLLGSLKQFLQRSSGLLP